MALFSKSVEHSVHLIHENTEVLFRQNDNNTIDNESNKEYVKTKLAREYSQAIRLPDYLNSGSSSSVLSIPPTLRRETPTYTSKVSTTSTEVAETIHYDHAASKDLIQRQQGQEFYSAEKPEWHAPWKLMRVIAGHNGWVRALAVEPENKWFASGSNDSTIKVWDLASGKLKLTLTGHVMTVRDLVVSDRHPYMFSCGEDKSVKCWDLEKNKIVRDYHGHLSGVYTLDLHPTLDVLVTGSRDSTLKVWDVRTSTAIFTLSGHKSPITKVRCQSTDPQIVSTSNDKTIRLWDLAAGKTQTVLTHHKKSIRALALHPTDWTFATGAPDNIKQWKFPEGSFVHNFMPQHQSIVNTLSVNQENVMFSGGDNGSMCFFDWRSGHKFQETNTTNLPGSLESEAGICSSTFDRTGLRLITGESDKSIKIWREDPDASPETHPGEPFDPEQFRQRY